MNQLFAERFKSARLLSGFSLQDLADRLDNRVTRQSLHKYEKGEMVPDSEMINLLGDALKVVPDFFFREIRTELSSVEWRLLGGLSAKDGYRIVEEVKDRVSRYLELEEILSIRTEFVNPLEGFPEITGLADIERAADQVRRVWELGTGAIPNCIEILEDHHIKVIDIDVKDGFDGMQAYANENIPIIAYNKAKLKTMDRIRFTVLHELGHLTLPIRHLTEREKETICHQFAAAMLFPRKIAKVELGEHRSRLMMQELGALKKQFGISIQAILVRAKDLDIISDNYCKNLFLYMKEMDWRVNEPFAYEAVEESGRFNQILFRALAEDLISMSKAAALTNQSSADFRESSLIIR